MINKLRCNNSRYNHYFNNKNNILIFLILAMGIIVPLFSYSVTFNFWSRLYSTLTSYSFNLMFFLAMSFNIIFLSSELSKNYNTNSRYNSYEKIIKIFIYNIICTTIILFISSLLLAISGAILFSLGDFQMINHRVYQIPMIYYIVFHVIKLVIFSMLINIIIYMLLLISKNKIINSLIIVLNVSFFFIPSNNNVITKFYKMPLLYQNHLMAPNFATFPLEIVCSMILFLIIYIIYRIIFNVVTSKKRDL